VELGIQKYFKVILARQLMKLVTDGKFTCEEIEDGQEKLFKLVPSYYARQAMTKTIKD